MDYQAWLIEKVADEAQMEISEISADMKFEDMDLDSLSLIDISFELEELLGKSIDPSVFSQYSTIEELAAWIQSNN